MQTRGGWACALAVTLATLASRRPAWLQSVYTVINEEWQHAAVQVGSMGLGNLAAAALGLTPSEEPVTLTSPGSLAKTVLKHNNTRCPECPHTRRSDSPDRQDRKKGHRGAHMLDGGLILHGAPRRKTLSSLTGPSDSPQC